jgi:cytochrome c556
MMNKALQILILATPLVFATQASAADQDTRTRVDLPEMMKTHMLGNMRDHLQSLYEIQAALATGQLDKAADIAESRIGMSSLISHDASHMAPFMPEGMQSIGTEMHHAASRFAMTANEGDLPKALQALSEVTAQCVACHMNYRVN